MTSGICIETLCASAAESRPHPSLRERRHAINFAMSLSTSLQSRPVQQNGDTYRQKLMIDYAFSAYRYVVTPNEADEIMYGDLWDDVDHYCTYMIGIYTDYTPYRRTPSSRTRSGPYLNASLRPIHSRGHLRDTLVQSDGGSSADFDDFDGVFCHELSEPEDDSTWTSEDDEDWASASVDSEIGDEPLPLYTRDVLPRYIHATDSPPSYSLTQIVEGITEASPEPNETEGAMARPRSLLKIASSMGYKANTVRRVLSRRLRAPRSVRANVQ
ncbi:hypothetical protein F4780DRAFT_197973 [Xylariomycetidae sp. FL0641]|nr:hypothetical protein F4780DRAFT_197973 [Xylariomycetidae sp. FL0641]